MGKDWKKPAGLNASVTGRRVKAVSKRETGAGVTELPRYASDNEPPVEQALVKGSSIDEENLEKRVGWLKKLGRDASSDEVDEFFNPVEGTARGEVRRRMDSNLISGCQTYDRDVYNRMMRLIGNKRPTVVVAHGNRRYLEKLARVTKEIEGTGARVFWINRTSEYIWNADYYEAKNPNVDKRWNADPGTLHVGRPGKKRRYAFGSEASIVIRLPEDPELQKEAMQKIWELSTIKSGKAIEDSWLDSDIRCYNTDVYKGRGQHKMVKVSMVSYKGEDTVVSSLSKKHAKILKDSAGDGVEVEEKDVYINQELYKYIKEVEDKYQL